MKMTAQEVKIAFNRMLRGDQSLKKQMSLEERQDLIRHVLICTMRVKGPVRFFFHNPYIFENISESFLREWRDYLNWETIWDYYDTPSKNFIRQFKKSEQ